MWQALVNALFKKPWRWSRSTPFETVKLPGWWCIFDQKGKIYHLSPKFLQLLGDEEKTPRFLWQDPNSPFTDDFQEAIYAIFKKSSRIQRNEPVIQQLYLGGEQLTVCLWQLEKTAYFILWIPKRIVADTVNIQKGMSLEKRFPLSALSSILQGFPILLWHRDTKQQVDFCHLLYQEIKDPSFASLLWDKPTFFSSKTLLQLSQKVQETGKPQQAYFSQDQKKGPHLFEVWEKPDLLRQGTWGLGMNISTHEKQRKFMAKQLVVFKKTTESISQGVVFFDHSKRLCYANKSFLKLFNLTSTWASKKPSFEEFFDELRYQRMIPEVSDFSAYKKRFLSFFQERRYIQELLHLPDERSLKMTLVPKASSSLTLIFEDVSEQLQLERKYNSLLANQQTLIANLQEGIVIFGVDQCVVTFNPAFEPLLFSGNPGLKKGMRLENYLEKKRTLFANQSQFKTFKKNLLTAISQHHASTGTCHLKQGKQLGFKYTPLPNGEHLLIYHTTHLSQKGTVLLEEALCLLENSWGLSGVKKESFFLGKEKKTADLRTTLQFLENVFQPLIFKKKLVVCFPKIEPLVSFKVPEQQEHSFRFLYYLMGYVFQKASHSSRIFFNFQEKKNIKKLNITYKTEAPPQLKHVLLETFAETCNVQLFHQLKKKGEIIATCCFKT